MPTTYKRPTAGRKYLAAERADQQAREAARARASEYTDVIRACQAIRCDTDAATILERQYR